MPRIRMVKASWSCWSASMLAANCPAERRPWATDHAAQETDAARPAPAAVRRRTAAVFQDASDTVFRVEPDFRNVSAPQLARDGRTAPGEHPGGVGHLVAEAVAAKAPPRSIARFRLKAGLRPSTTWRRTPQDFLGTIRSTLHMPTQVRCCMCGRISASFAVRGPAAARGKGVTMTLRANCRRSGGCPRDPSSTCA